MTSSWTLIYRNDQNAGFFAARDDRYVPLGDMAPTTYTREEDDNVEP